MSVKRFLKKYQFVLTVIIILLVAILAYYIGAYYKYKNYDWARESFKHYQSSLLYLEKTRKNQKQQFDIDNLKTLDHIDTSKIGIEE